MMLPSPVTSTPFSVKDILNLEQQQDPHYGAQLPHHLEHHFHPAACLLAAADGARFSDGEEEEEEEKLSYLSPMAAPGSQADTRISADNYVHAVLRGSCEAPGPGEELDPAVRDPSEYQLRRAPPYCTAPPGRATRWLPVVRSQPSGIAPRIPGPGAIAGSTSLGHIEPGQARCGAATALLRASLASSLESFSARPQSEGAGSGPRSAISVAEGEKRVGLGPIRTRCGGARGPSRCPALCATRPGALFAVPQR